jgi:hypothetical protein
MALNDVRPIKDAAPLAGSERMRNRWRRRIFQKRLSQGLAATNAFLCAGIKFLLNRRRPRSIEILLDSIVKNRTEQPHDRRRNLRDRYPSDLWPRLPVEQRRARGTDRAHKSDAKAARVIGIGFAVIVAIVATPILVALIVLLAVYYSIALDAVALALASLTPTVLLVLFASVGIIWANEKSNQQLIREIKKNDLRSLESHQPRG